MTMQHRLQQQTHLQAVHSTWSLFYEVCGWGILMTEGVPATVDSHTHPYTAHADHCPSHGHPAPTRGLNMLVHIGVLSTTVPQIQHEAPAAVLFALSCVFQTSA
jgi:hypothetical protein